MKKKKMIQLGFVVLILVGLVWGIVSTLFNKTPAPFVLKDLKEHTRPAWKDTTSITNEEYIPYMDKYDVVKNNDIFKSRATKKYPNYGKMALNYFSQHINYTAPNGKPITILAQEEVTDSQMLYAYSLLEFYLSNFDDEIANRMAENEATLVMTNGADGQGSTPEKAMLGQSLTQTETAPPGSKWYMESDYGHRDAAFEEIFHLVHDFGIGTTSTPQAYPELAKKIKDAQIYAYDNNLWVKTLTMKLFWLPGIKKEGSLEQEYIITPIDMYYGLWEAYEKDGMYGAYVAKSRESLEIGDPMGYELVTSFLPEFINTFMYLDETFSGTFSMKRDEAFPYTFKSQYLKNLVITGSHDTTLIGNNEDNVFMTGSGNNHIDGSLGHDILQLKGPSKDYEIISQGDKIIIKDSVPNRDGIVTLMNIEIMRFTDIDISKKK